MNYVTLIDSTDEEDCTRLINTMKTFNVPLDYSDTNISDFLDVQTIMKEGKIQDLSKCIQNVLNYDLHSLTNNGIRVLDPSFITLFHVGQFIIKFLLFWKTKLSNENTELRSQLREREKLRKDDLLRKLEVRDLKSQLALHLRPSNSTVSECSQCKKVFVNDTYLYAHHKRRHGDEPFVSNRNEIQYLHGELRSLKQQLVNMQRKNYGSTAPPSKSIKMKLVPEMSCRETQEKYWKGKLKELCDSYEEEKRRLASVRDDLEDENARLKRKIDDITTIRKTKSAETQTESSGLAASSEYFQPLGIGKRSSLSDLLNGDSRLQSTSLDIINTTKASVHLSDSMPNFLSSNFHDWLADAHDEPHQSFLPNENNIDIVDETDSFLARCNHVEKFKEKKHFDQNFMTLDKNECRDKDRRVIAKCFPSEQLVNKLIEIYDKQESLAPDTEIFCVSKACDTDRVLFPQGTEKKSRANEVGNRSTAEPTTSTKDTSNIDAEENLSDTLSIASSNSIKPKSKILPFLKNIPIKILKNYTKSRKKCVNVTEGKQLKRLSSNNLLKKIDATEMKPCDEIEFSKDKLLGSESNSPERVHPDLKDERSELKLVSALKKSKSTGNQVKKVMFSDKSPTVEKKAPCNFSEFSSEDSQPETPPRSTVLSTVDENNDKSIPIPAPRAREKAFGTNAQR